MAKIYQRSGEVDGATAVGHELDTKNSLVTPGAKLLSVKNAGVEKFAVDKDGNVLNSGANNTWVVTPETGRAGIAAALTAAGAAGGGTIQLLAGTYDIPAELGAPADCRNITIQGVGDNTVLDLMGTASGAFLFTKTASGSRGLNTVTVGDTSVYTTTAAWAGAFLAGDTIAVEGTDPDGFKDRFWFKVMEDGDEDTGEIKLGGMAPVTLVTGAYPCSAGNIRDAANLRIRDLRITNGPSYGVGVVGFEGVAVENVFFDNVTLTVGGSGYYTHDVRVSGCRFIGDGVKGGYTVSLMDVGRVAVVGCRLENWVSAGVVMDDVQDASVLDNHFSGFSASSAAAVVMHNTFSQRVHVDRNSIENIQGSGIIVRGNGVVVRDNFLTNCAITTVEPALIVAPGSARVSVLYNVISHVKFGLVAQATGTQIIGNTIRDVYAGGTAPYGLGVFDGTKMVVRDNVLDGIFSYGLLAYAADSIYVGNIVDNVGGVGIHAMTTSKLLIANNQVRNSAMAGIALDNDVTDSMVTGNHCNGLGVSLGTGAGNIGGLNKE